MGIGYKYIMSESIINLQPWSKLRKSTMNMTTEYYTCDACIQLYSYRMPFWISLKSVCFAPGPGLLSFVLH